MIKYIQTSEVFGDCSANYDVKLNKPHTVGEFINLVLSERKGEWGKFEIYNPDVSWLDYERYEYRHGILKDVISKEILEKRIISIEAHGGWTQMDYLLKLEK